MKPEKQYPKKGHKPTDGLRGKVQPAGKYRPMKGDKNANC